MSTAAAVTARKRAASRSQKMPPQVKRSGTSRTAIGLREEHRGVGVVPGGEVLEGDRHEQRVVVAGALQLGRASRARPRAARRLRGCGPGCRSGCTSGRRPGAGGRPRRSAAGWKASSESRKSGTPKPPSAQRRRSATQRPVVRGVVREQRAQLLDRGDDPFHCLPRPAPAAGAPSASKSMEPSFDCQGRIVSTASLSALQAGCRMMPSPAASPVGTDRELFPHDPSSTGEPCVKTPYSRHLILHKGSYGEL